MNTFTSGEKVHLTFKDELNRNNLYVRGRVFNETYDLIKTKTLNPIEADDGLYKNKTTLDEVGFYIVVFALFTDPTFTTPADPPKNVCEFFRVQPDFCEVITDKIESSNTRTA